MEIPQLILTLYLILSFCGSLFRIARNKYGEFTETPQAIGGIIGYFLKYGIIFYLLYLGEYYKL